ncbi:MAG: hypothetical protein J1G38_02030 [Clostridiales bacterium]|nr:hypothetical protein [Clostridiales bacterium]
MTKAKRLAAFTALIAACILFVAIAFLFIGCEEEKTSWDISIDSASKVSAKLVKNGGGYTLKISGKGYSDSWDSAKAVPWHDSVSKIKKVEIQSGVESVGAYAFYGIRVDSIVLPDTVADIGKNAVSENVLFFAYSEDLCLAYADIYPMYLYSEVPPESYDRFWQQDMSKGDIFDSAEDLVKDEGCYWHYENGKAVVLEKTKILFIGNSFTYRNGVVEHSSGVPGIFDNIAEDLGYWVETYSVTGPGWYLKNHAKSTDACGKQVDKILNARDDFDYVVLQEQSLNPFENYQDFLGGVKALIDKIEKTQDHAQIILYETWGSPYSANEKKTTIPEMESWLRKAYTDAAEECGGLTVSYVGKAFTDVYRHEPSIYLWATDNRHQGYTGAYLSACVHVGTILGGDVRNTTFKGEAQYNAPDLADSVYEALRNSAYNVVFGEIDEGEQPAPSSEYSLEVAVWGRWMTEEQFTALFDGFKAYAAQNKLDTKRIHYTYYAGATSSDSYYYIANFTNTVVARGGADIIFPCAANLTTQEGTRIEKAEIEQLRITLNGKTDRCVAKLTNTELSNAFFDYCLSDEGKSILDPTYTPSV